VDAVRDVLWILCHPRQTRTLIAGLSMGLGAMMRGKEGVGLSGARTVAHVAARAFADDCALYDLVQRSVYHGFCEPYDIGLRRGGVHSG
jgi:hypothetical protein